MAISQLPASRAITRELPTRPSLRILQGLPSLRTAPGEKVTSGAFVILMGSIAFVGLLSLLAINILMTQDAFTLQHLKHQTNIINDQRDAVVRQAASMSSPAHLASSAIKLGMKPASQLTYITLNNEMPVK